MDERDFPKRAELESIMWALNHVYQTEQERVDMLTSFLHERGVPDQEIDRILDDLPSYQNWKVASPVVAEEENAEPSTPADNPEP